MAELGVLSSNTNPETFEKVSRLEAPELESEPNPSSSDTDDHVSEPQDSGRRRSSRRKPASQSSQQEDKQEGKDELDTSRGSEKSDAGRGRKRKKNQTGERSGSDSDEDSNKKRPTRAAEPVWTDPSEPICTCPKDVMRCIGILPSLPIVSHFYDSDNSESSEECNFPVLPTVARNPRRHESG